MSRNRVVLLLASVLVLVLVAPAFGGPDVLKRVKKLERRVNAIAVLVVGSNELAVTRYDDVMLAIGGGGYAGSARCSSGKAVGGGVQVLGQRYTTYHMVESRPQDEFAWYAEWTTGPAPPPAGVRVWVSCVDLG